MENDVKSKRRLNKDIKHELVDSCINTLLSIEVNTDINFCQLLNISSEEFNVKSFDETTLFDLYDTFMNECKKRKILLHKYYHCNDYVGIPYTINFCRLDPNTAIRSVIYNYSYGCWGVIDELNREYTVFTQDKISIHKRPLRNETFIDNPKITISYNPYNRHHYDHDINSDYNFEKLCELALLVDTEPKSHIVICDACGPEIKITYYNGKSKYINRMNEDALTDFIEYINQFIPNYSIKIINNENKDDFDEKE